MTRKLCFYAFLFGLFCTSGFALGQTKNRITVQTGLFHYYFDQAPILNVNYQSDAGSNPFNGLLLNSLGIKYTRNINTNSFFSVEYNMFEEQYVKHYKTYPLKEPMVGNRGFSTYNVSYGRILPLNNQFNFVYGGGVNYRRGLEVIIVSNHPLGGSLSGNSEYNTPLMESSVVTVVRNDIGINAFGGIEYTPLKWLTLSTKIDLLGFIYINDKEKTRKMKEVYDSPQYPTRFDLSFNLGLGFNF
ncbi:MAG: hypothetical protein WED10_12480 [Brumimicrobium sp.]